MSERLGDIIQTADWKAEKHVPVIDCADKVKSGEWLKVTLSIGKEISHPNSIEHHIGWVKAYFTPDSSNFAFDLGDFKFNVHGEGALHTHPEATFAFKTEKAGTINALSYCNIHGLWESSKKIELE
jgi:superoxide reductase